MALTLRSKEFDIAEWINEHNILVKREGPWNAGGYKWVLEECPWNSHTDNAAYIVQHPSGAIAAGCHHNSCQDYGWRELREHYEPGAYERKEGSPNGAEGGDVPETAAWPELAKEALYGLPDEIVSTIEPHTEADIVAVLANLLTAFGNAIGGGAYFRVGADKHHLKLNVALVGETSKGRKGMSWGYVKELMHVAEPSWVEDRVVNGLSSGEGLIHAVRDRVVTNKDGDEMVVDEGVSDKRLLVMEGELASVLKLMTREGNTLSPTIRTAWDGGKLCTLTKNSPLQATGSHISIIGHITKAELLRHLSETEAANGFANRFIWLLVKRSKKLPFGGEWHRVDVAPLVKKLRSAVEFGKEAGEIAWGESAKELWVEVYGPLSEGKLGLFGAVTGRAEEAQVVRLAALYAVMDGSRTIERPHLEAALALWRYAEDSARYIFGDATGDRVADRIMEALEDAPNGLTRNEIRDLFSRHKSSEDIGQALSLLEELGRVRCVKETTEGRPAERWYKK